MDVTFDSIGDIIDEYKNDNSALEKMKYKIKQEQDRKNAEEKIQKEYNKATQEVHIVIEACANKFMFTPTVEEVMESYAHDNKVSGYGLRNYYSFNMDTMKKFITETCYDKPGSWKELHRCWVEYCNTMYGLR